MAYKITIGDLRRFVTLQYFTKAQDSSGSWTETWTDWKTNVAAKISNDSFSNRSLGGREYVGAEQMQSETTHQIIIRYLRGVTTANRVKWGSRIFDIQTVINIDEANRWLVLMCVENTKDAA